MFDQDRWQEIFAVLKSNKLRSTLTAFGIFWGILMLIVMIGAGTALQNGVFKNIGDFATNSCFIWTQSTTLPYKGFKKGRRFSFDLSDSEILRERVHGIKHVSPRYNRGSVNISYKKKVEAYSIMGDFPEFNKIDPVDILEGRFVNQKDIDENRKIIVIGIRPSEVLFNSHKEALGKYLKINGVYFQVVGVFKSKHGANDSYNENIIMPLTTMQRCFNLGTVVGWFSVTAKENIPVKEVEAEAISLLKAAHFVHPDDKMAIGHFNVQEQLIKVNGLFLGIKILIWIVGIGMLTAGLIGVSNVMLIVVRERTQEFGIQRAIGATPANIISQLLLESVILTFTAGYIGMFIGAVLLEWFNKIIIDNGIDFLYNPEINIKVAISALMVLIIGGLLAGIAPALRAVSIKPVDAIRSEY